MQTMPRLDLIQTIYLRRRIKIQDQSSSAELMISNGEIPSLDIISELMRKQGDDQKKIASNVTKINHHQLPKSYYELAFAIHFLQEEGKKYLIFQKENDTFNKDAKIIYLDYAFQNYGETYLANLYSMPISIESINKINSALHASINNEARYEHDIIKTLGRAMTIDIAKQWLKIKHPDILQKIPNTFSTYPQNLKKECLLTLIHYCHYANKKTYNSKVTIAKKIYNFRVNRLKKKTFPDNSNSVKLQVEIHQSTMLEIKNFAEKNAITISDAVTNLINNGLANLTHGTGAVTYGALQSAFTPQPNYVHQPAFTPQPGNFAQPINMGYPVGQPLGIGPNGIPRAP